jgi:hypothetical protein
LRKLRWEVEQFHYAEPDAGEPTPRHFRFRTKALAFEHWQREMDHGRFFLGAVLYLHLPGGRIKLLRVHAAEGDPIDELCRFCGEDTSEDSSDIDELLFF